jgi:hypothetical protein
MRDPRRLCAPDATDWGGAVSVNSGARVSMLYVVAMLLALAAMVGTTMLCLV